MHRPGAARRARCPAGRSEAGASLVEYALLIALIAVACVAAVALFGGSIADRILDSGSKLFSTALVLSRRST